MAKTDPNVKLFKPKSYSNSECPKTLSLLHQTLSNKFESRVSFKLNPKNSSIPVVSINKPGTQPLISIANQVQGRCFRFGLFPFSLNR